MSECARAAAPGGRTPVDPAPGGPTLAGRAPDGHPPEGHSPGGRPAYPLSAIVGQEQLVRALLINAVAPQVGGVLVRGQRGTAKSTAVRALAPLLAGLSDGAAPLIEVPLGATLDRLLGTIDLRRALAGEHRYEPGLLARADGGILYVDEVNLLADHLVDALLDAAASGVVRVERDAVSVEHEARFMLVGTMNLEEGELRPQLLDRFGLGVEVRGPQDPAVRAEIVRRRLAFEADPEGFAARFAPAQRQLAERIKNARERLSRVRLPERELLRIAGACARLGIDGARGDIVWCRAALALAALDGAAEVGAEHVRAAAPLAISHRRRSDPLGGPDGPGGGRGPGDGSAPGAGGGRDGGWEELERALAEPPAAPAGARPGAASPHSAARAQAAPDGDPTTPDGNARQTSDADPQAPAPSARSAPQPARLPALALALARSGHGPAGRRARSAGPQAGALDSRPAAPGAVDLAVVASLRAHLLADGPRSGPIALREHIRAGRESALLCLIVDASGSMGARRRLARVKGALLALLRDAYARRDRVAIVAFAREGARLLAAPGTPLQRAADAVRELPTGGATPLADGLDLAATLIRRERAREPSRRALALLLTDGRVADPAGAARAAAARLGRAADVVQVIDLEEGPVRIGLARALAAAAGGGHHQLRSAA